MFWGSSLNCMPPSFYPGARVCAPDPVLSAGLELSPEMGCLLMRPSLAVCAWEWVRTADFVGYVWDVSIRGGGVCKRERTLRVSDRTDSCVSFVGAWSSSGRKRPPGWQRESYRAFWIFSLVSSAVWGLGREIRGTFLSRLLRPFVWPHGGELGWDFGLRGS